MEKYFDQKHTDEELMKNALDTVIERTSGPLPSHIDTPEKMKARYEKMKSEEGGASSDFAKTFANINPENISVDELYVKLKKDKEHAVYLLQNTSDIIANSIEERAEKYDEIKKDIETTDYWLEKVKEYISANKLEMSKQKRSVNPSIQEGLYGAGINMT